MSTRLFGIVLTVTAALASSPLEGSGGPYGLIPITPELLRQVYNVGGSAYTPDRTGKNRQAILVGVGNANISEADVQVFLRTYGTPAQANQTIAKRVGPLGDPESTGFEETLLDVQNIMGVAGPYVPTEIWAMGGWESTQPCWGLKNWTDRVLALQNPPLVFSLSFGLPLSMWTEHYDCPASRRAVIDRNFEELGKRGVSIIAASGDSGSGYKSLPGKDILPSTWPAGSPWVTAVGATKFLSQDQPTAEKQAALELSEGGFVETGKAPEYQRAATQLYLERAVLSGALPPVGTFNAHGRGFPDVSMVGQFSYVVRQSGEWVWGGYTSAAAPAFAGLVSLLNGARLARGLPPLGFLNPFLYANADAFTDIMVGKNNGWRGDDCSNTNPNCIAKLKFGWLTEKGWDPATGLGTPDYQKLLEAALEWHDDSAQIGSA